MTERSEKNALTELGSKPLLARIDTLERCLRAVRPALVRYSDSGNMDPKDCNASGYSKPLARLDRVLSANAEGQHHE